MIQSYICLVHKTELLKSFPVFFFFPLIFSKEEKKNKKEHLGDGGSHRWLTNWVGQMAFMITPRKSRGYCWWLLMLLLATQVGSPVWHNLRKLHHRNPGV